MTLNQDIFAVKLYEMEKQYGRLQSRLRICGRENRKKLQAELEHAKEEYEENSLLLKQSIQGSRSPAVAELAQVQWEYMHKVEDLLKEKAEQFFHCEATSQEEDQAEAASLAQVRGITPLTAEVGEVFETGPDDTGKLEYLCAILDQIQERGMTADVGYIDMSNINSPSFSYKDRFVVKLGNFEETEYRFGKLLSAVSQLVEGDRGTIDVSPEGEKTVFSPY